MPTFSTFVYDYFHLLTPNTYKVTLFSNSHNFTLFNYCFKHTVSYVFQKSKVKSQKRAKILQTPLKFSPSLSLCLIFVGFTHHKYNHQRYWNACGDVHHFMGKWLDAAVHTGIYHLQCKHYDPIKPPNYFDNHDLNKFRLSRDREIEREDDFFTGSESEYDRKTYQKYKKRRIKMNRMSINSCRTIPDAMQCPSTDQEEDCDASVASLSSPMVSANTTTRGLIDNSRYLMSEGRLDGGWDSAFGDNDSSSTFHRKGTPWKDGNSRGFATVYPGGRTPSLFLQELAHLTSLLSAVACSTLRNDVEFAYSPLDMYHPGSMFPKEDPWKDITKTEHCTLFKYLFGCDRSPASRTRYNAARPLQVLGGVSPNEIKFIQRAKGPSAKVALCTGWLAEFIIREERAGTLGHIGPPIISRVMQFLSDGSIYYNHARKTVFIPFPFPHAQLSAFFNLTMMIAIPLLMDQYLNELWLGSLLTFLTVTCLSGLHEVARELENPFRNIPNEIPLFTLQAMFNEALLTIYSGYHPDHYWDGDEYRRYAKMFGSEKQNNGNGTPASRRVKTPPTSPMRKNEFRSKLSSPMTKTKSRSCGSEQLISVFELQQLVMKQSDEIKRLTNKYEYEASPTTSSSFD